MGGGVEVDVTLDKLPVELLLKIFQHLQVKFITQVLANVCTLFRDLAENSNNWKIRIKQRWVGQYPPLPPDYPIDWTQACIDREEADRVWCENGDGMLHCSNSSSHYASVDAIHVMNSIVATGSRDHSIHLWSTDDCGDCLQPVSRNLTAHSGWVWSFASQDNLLVSGAWDSTVKFWQVSPTGLQEARSKARLKTAVLCLDICDNRIAAGTFDNKVVQLDSREEIRKMSFYKSHSRPVLKVKITPTRIYSISEDGNLAVHDRVAGKLWKKSKIPGVMPDSVQTCYPLSMDSMGNCLYVGDSAGNLNLVDITAESALQFVQSYKTGHTGRITGVQSSLGSVVTCATDGAIKIYHPSSNLEPLSSIQVGRGNVVTGISCRNKVLAAATCDNGVYIWRPKD